MKNCFVFVILHYLIIEETKKCAESIIKNCKGKNFKIIIVDNASPNKSGEELKKYYRKNKYVEVLLNKENLGFSKGNNVGFMYAKKNYNPDFIILCNNDTCLLDNNFTDIVNEEYSKSNFAVLGPKIIFNDNDVKPVRVEIPTLSKAKKGKIYLQLKLISTYLFLNYILDFIIKNVKKVSNNNYCVNNHDIVDKRIENNCILYGCFLIFSKEYINRFDGLDDKTFFYGEEDLLWIRLKSNKLNFVYNPKLRICRNSFGATQASKKSNRSKNIFMLKNKIKAQKVIIKELEKYEQEGGNLEQ